MNAPPRLSSRLAPRERRALLLGALVTLPVLANAFVARPFLNTLRETRGAVARERELLQREVTLLAAAPRIPAEITLARRTAGVARTRLFTGTDGIEATSALSSYVGNALRAQRVTVHQVESRDAAVSRAGLREIAIDVRAEGSLQAVLRALRALESGPRLTRVTRVSVERSAMPGGEGESLVLAATIRGYALIGGAE